MLNAPEEGECVSNLAWRPDGKLLAVSYENSKSLHLVDIENKSILNKKEHESKKNVTCMAWLPLEDRLPIDFTDNINTGKFMASPTGKYLPPLPSLNRGFSHEPERKDFLFQTLDMLFVSKIIINLFVGLTNHFSLYYNLLIFSLDTTMAR